MGTTDFKKNILVIEKHIKSLAYNKNNLLSFEEFNSILKTEVFGIVLTAHPTFGMTYQMMIELAKLATSKEQKKYLTDKELKKNCKRSF